MLDAVEQRRSRPREAVIKSAKVVIGRSIMNCLVLDVSEGGARLRLDAPMTLPGEFTLCFRGGAGFAARPCWSHGHEVGVAFTGPPRLTNRSAMDAAAVRKALEESRFGGALELLRAVRFFDDPQLAAIARDANWSVEKLATALEAYGREGAESMPELFNA